MGVAGALEPIKGIGHVTCARLKRADVKCKGVPAIPATKTLVQVLLMQAANSTLLIGASDSITLFRSMLANDQGGEIFLGCLLAETFRFQSSAEYRMGKTKPEVHFQRLAASSNRLVIAARREIHHTDEVVDGQGKRVALQGRLNVRE